MQEFSYRPWNPVKVKRYAVSGLCGLLCAMIYICLYHDLKPQPVMATVDVTGLVRGFVKKEASQSVPSEQMHAQIKNFSQNLELVLQNLAREKHWVLLPKEAILAGCPDKTEEVEARLKTLESSNASAS